MEVTTCLKTIPLELVYRYILPCIPHLGITVNDLQLIKKKIYIYNFIRKDVGIENKEIYNIIFKTDAITLQCNFFKIVTPDLYLSMEFIPKSNELVTWRLVG
jgi:hypothetical protein